MAKVFLFGSASVFGVPDVVANELENLINTYPDIEFLVGDKNGAESAFHKTLSAIGGRYKTKVYTLDKIPVNKFELETVELKSAYLPDEKKAVIYIKDTEEVLGEIEDIEKVEDVVYDRRYYEFLDRYLIGLCDIAICLWDGKSKGTFNNIQLLNIKNKKCYTYKLDI